MKGGKQENPEKNPRSEERTNNKVEVNPHVAASTGIEPGSQRWEASAYPLRHPCSPIMRHSIQFEGQYVRIQCFAIPQRGYIYS